MKTQTYNAHIESRPGDMGTCLVSTGRLSLCAERGCVMEEEWRAIEGFPHYEVSNRGVVRKVKPIRKMDNTPLFVPLVGCIRKGYQAIGLRGPDGTRHWKSVHVLVLETFVGPRPPGFISHHKDTNTRNNAEINLEWVTYSDNTKQAYEAGNLSQRGSKNNGSLLNESQVIEIKRLLAEGSLRHEEIGILYGVARNTITQINCGINWGYLEA